MTRSEMYRWPEKKMCFDKFCRSKECEHYVEWEHTEEIRDYHQTYQSVIECCSCELVGQSYNVDMYNEFCPYQEEIKDFEKELIKAQKAFKKKCEQETIWSRLNDIT